MDTYGERIAAALASLNRVDRDRAWLAGQVGISLSALSQVILGKTKAFTAANHEAAVDALACNGKWLATGKGEMRPSSTERKQNQAIAPADIAPVATNSVAGKTLSVYAHALGLMFDALPDDKILRSKVYARLTATIYEVIDPAEPEPQPEPAAAAHPKKLTA